MKNLMSIIVCFLLLGNVAYAAENAAPERCRQSNSADCDQVLLKPDAAPATPSAAATKSDAADSLLGNPYFILAIIGLLQGMISRAGIGSLVLVAVVMPAIATWSLVSGAHFEPGIVAIVEYVGMELLGTFIFCMAGWGTGVAIRRGLHKLIFG